ncbi:hypothetical protein GCM10009733_083220 [Nonomuraea maheshkhaliensis]|uniref:Secreted protein n=1 Tax=Nonomuraea maheshkhaliensis TaxID=419590 RepID=A0ABN2GLW7_9ACTN
MKLFRKTMVAASMAMAVSSAAMLGAAPAHAEVWDCVSFIDNNVGSAICYAGFGSYQVRVSCASAHWPYTREIHGPVVYKAQNQTIGPESSVNGAANGCHITDAWVHAL